MRKRKGVAQVLIGLVLVAALVLTPMACKAPVEAPPVAPPEEVAPPVEAPPVEAPPVEAPPVEAPPVAEIKAFRGLADIPEIKNRSPIHIAAMGFNIEFLQPQLDKFEEATGLELNVEVMSFTLVYPKLNLELTGRTGAYDMTLVESSWTCEWAPYLWDMDELADEFDPGGRAAFRADMENVYPACLRQASDRERKLRGTPWYTFQQGVILRQDVYDDPTEQANFLERYGYELAAPTTYEQVFDQGEFFTRKTGELLKGEPLEWDLWGLGICGMYETNDEASAEIWGRGGHWVTIVRDEQDRPIEFVVSSENKAAIKKALESLKFELDNYCSPGCMTGAWWDVIVPEFTKGRTILCPHLYQNQNLVGWAVEDEIPGAKLGIYPPVGGHGYAGNWHQACIKDGRNPEGVYWLLRYLISEEAEREMGEAGMTGTIRMDVNRDPKYQTPEWWKLVGQLAAVQNAQFTTTETAEQMDSYLWFNSSAGGKIYEMTIILCHEAVAGIRPMDEVVDDIVSQMVELQNKFGSLPMREEL